MPWTWRDVAWFVLLPWKPAILFVDHFGLDPLGVLDRCGIRDVLGVRAPASPPAAAGAGAPGHARVPGVEIR